MCFVLFVSVSCRLVFHHSSNQLRDIVELIAVCSLSRLSLFCYLSVSGLSLKRCFPRYSGKQRGHYSSQGGDFLCSTMVISKTSK